MRKWMRDRLKRKKPETGKGEPGPAPLQPAYFDAAPGSSASGEVNQLEADVPVNDIQDSPEEAPVELADAPSSGSSQPQREGGGGEAQIRAVAVAVDEEGGEEVVRGRPRHRRPIELRPSHLLRATQQRPSPR